MSTTALSAAEFTVSEQNPQGVRVKRVPLSQLTKGARAVVREAKLPESDAAMLAAMGLRCDSEIRLCREGEPCIVSVLSAGRNACRIGLSRPLANSILVETVQGGA